MRSGGRAAGGRQLEEGISVFLISSSAEALLMVIAGGAGTLLGPLAGAATVIILKLVVSAYVTRWMLLLGLTFILIIFFLPSGM